MEYAKDEIFNITYNTTLNRVVTKQPKWTSKVKLFFRKHMIINIFFIAFIAFSSINLWLIYSFFCILKNI